MQLKVCIGSACHVKGSYNVINAFQQMIEQHQLFDQVELQAVFCLGHCTEAVSVKIDEGEVQSVSGVAARTFFEKEVLGKLELSK